MLNIMTKTDGISLTENKDANTAGRLLTFFNNTFASLTAIHKCDALYQQLGGQPHPREFLESVLKTLDIRLSVTAREENTIPAKGPLVVVANHPFGAIEGIILSAIFLGIRPDIKVMANAILDQIPQMRELLISVDLNASRKAVYANIGPTRKAIQWVQQGGMLLVFPSGTVSHANLSRREISDPAWNAGIGKIIHKAQAPVLPVFVNGANGKLFQILGLIHSALRTALLPRELLNKRRQQIRINIGKVLPYQQLREIGTEERLTNYLRWRTYLLRHAESAPVSVTRENTTNGPVSKRPAAAPLEPAICRAEIEALPVCQRLLTSGPYTVWQAASDQIPRVMLEIGRLREQSFRLAGEGTGRAVDLDTFDAHYLHLFIWQNDTNEIIGAYRLGRTDMILDTCGRSGLYTATLFRSHRDFYQSIGPALELGRSFVRPEYQKSYAPLLLLWRGIGQYIAKNPKYRMLFGPVSISRNYSDFSRRLLATILLRHHHAADIAASVQAKSPPILKPIRIKGCNFDWLENFCHPIDEINSIIAEIEADNKGMPILLKHYLKLGGRLVSFNVDKHFHDVLDGLIVVDLFRTDPKTLERYMGKDGAAMFLNFHQYLTEPIDRTNPDFKAA